MIASVVRPFGTYRAAFGLARTSPAGWTRVWQVAGQRTGLPCVYVATASSFFAVRWVWVRAYCADAAPLRPTAFGGHPARSAPPPTRGTRLPPEECRLATPISAQRWCKTPVAGPNYRGAAPHHFGTLRSVLHHFSERKTDENVISPEFAPSLPPTHPLRANFFFALHTPVRSGI